MVEDVDVVQLLRPEVVLLHLRVKVALALSKVMVGVTSCHLNSWLGCFALHLLLDLELIGYRSLLWLLR